MGAYHWLCDQRSTGSGILLDPDICQGFDSYVQIETEGISLGQSVVDFMDFYRKTPNTKVLTEVDVYAFFQLFLSRILGLEPEKTGYFAGFNIRSD